jgi:hypothetical protein
MNGDREYRFNTKTGTCVITPEKIVLKREGVTGTVANKVFGSSISRGLIIYSVIGSIALVIGILLIIGKGYFAGGFLCAVGAVCLGSVIASRNNSAANIIERSSVQSVVAHSPHPPFTRAYFTVNFLENGKRRKRLIGLPGSMSGGKEEFRRALSIMRKAGWYNH